MNANNFTQKTVEMIQTAQNMAEENQNQYITPEHLLYALVDQDGGFWVNWILPSPSCPKWADPTLRSISHRKLTVF